MIWTFPGNCSLIVRGWHCQVYYIITIRVVTSTLLVSPLSIMNLLSRRSSKAMSAHPDIIHLNVGGTKMTTTRQTLCQIERFSLASMFSEGKKDRLMRDEDGCIFLDFNPQHFSLILDYLRSKKAETKTDPALPCQSWLPKMPKASITLPVA